MVIMLFLYCNLYCIIDILCLPIIFQIGIKLKQILISTNCKVKVKISTYTNTMQTFKTVPFLRVEPWGFTIGENGVKARTWENAHEKKEKHLT